MQTFLPEPNFDLSAKRLDNQRLGKQLVEAMQIHKTLTGTSSGWSHHPAVRMWRGYEGALVRYGQAMYAEWRRRYLDGRRGGKLDHKSGEYFYYLSGEGDLPPWLGDGTFHASHRSNLLRKDAEFYGQFGWSEQPDLPYVWPEVGESNGTRAASGTP